MGIRLATPRDLTAINAIYNHYVETSTATFQTEPSTDAERQAWFESHGPQHPVTVFEDAGEVVAWAALNRYHARQAYGHTVENSVYVRDDQRGRGIGRALLSDLVERARELRHHAILAAIAGDQPASLALHEHAGFMFAGRFREVGWKFDQWLDVVFLERLLTQPDPRPQLT